MMGSAFAVDLPAYAQVTDQTDQSEEDWRKSRKKEGTTDIFKPNRRSTGSGSPIVDFEPISPVERLPSESRRHLMKERAKAIAESEDGDISDAEYVPSEAAKSDEDLMREEKEAWDVIVTDMKGSGGSGQAGEGPNKVAVSGQGGRTASGPRGGSTRTLQEIMDAIKNGGIAGGAGQGQSSQGPSGQGPSGGGQAGEGQTSSGAADGSGQGSDGQATQVADAGAAAGAGSADGSAQSGDQGDQGDADAPGGGQDGSGDQAGDSGAQGDGSDAGRTAEPLSPLERMRKAREERPATGAQRSASDYLGTSRED